MSRRHLYDQYVPPVAKQTLEPMAHKAHRLLRRSVSRYNARLRWLQGRRVGMDYRIAGRHPDEDVSDLVVAERVRAVLGLELKRLDVHGIHVEVLDHVVYLRGAAGLDETQRIERFVLKVPGVRGVESYLELLPDGAATGAAPSRVLERLLAIAHEEGCQPPLDRTAVLAVLGTFAGRIPPGELRHVWSHLPLDVRGLLRPPILLGATPHRLRTLDVFYRTVVAASGLELDKAEKLTGRLLSHLHSLVPEDAADVEEVLPGQLKQMWHAAGTV